MNEFYEEMHTCMGEIASFGCYLLGVAFKTSLVLAVLLAPFAVEWALDGCPEPEEAAVRLVEDIKEGWR